MCRCSRRPEGGQQGFCVAHVWGEGSAAITPVPPPPPLSSTSGAKQLKVYPLGFHQKQKPHIFTGKI